jgi:hypothetical protein
VVVFWRRAVCLILALTAWGAASCSSPTSPSSLAPQMNTVQPASGAPGQTVDITLTGTHFTVGDTAAVVVTGSGITVSNVSVQSPTSAAAALMIADSASLGPRTLTLTTATGGTSPAVTFTVVPPAPTLTAISPTSAVAGAAVTLTLTGTQFINDATSVEVSGSGVTVGRVTVQKSTSLTVDLSTDGSAAGDHSVTVKTAGGTSAGRTFTVSAPPAATIGAFGASPSSITSGQSAVLSWSGISDASNCSIDNGVGPVACAGTVSVSPTATTTYTLTANGPGGSATATATIAVAPAPTSAPAPAPGPTPAPAPAPAPAPGPGPTPAPPPVPQPAAPTLSSMSPDSGESGDNVNVSLSGTNFVPGQTTVSVNSRDVSVSGVSVRSTTSLTARFGIKKHADSGQFQVTVRTPGGTSNAVTFAVTESHHD